LGGDSHHGDWWPMSRCAGLRARKITGIVKANMIKRQRNEYRVFSSKGKNLGGPYRTLAEAKQRLRQIEFFKRRRAPAKCSTG
jgi:hypothetical protein